MKRTLLTLAAALFLLPASAQQVPEWLKEGILYHIYPSSFKDSDGDGIGDLEGIRSKLPYVKSLGANTIWLSPVFRSEFEDGGYDITDFYRIDPRFGTNSQLVQLVREAHDLGIRVCLDLVAGHTSDKHPWFRQSSEADPELQYSDYYIWSDSKDSLPTKKFVRSDAARDGNYMKNFFDIQPALNYGYLHPDPAQPWQQGYDDPGPTAVRNELKNIISFWMDKGVDGFRCDMAQSLVKGDDKQHTGTMRLWHELRSWFEAKYPEGILISEWSQPRQSLRAGFHIDLLIHNGAGTKIYRTLVCQTDDRGTKETPCFFDYEGRGQVKAFAENYRIEYEATRELGYAAMPTCSHDIWRLNRFDRNTPEQLKTALTLFLTLPAGPILYYGRRPRQGGQLHEPQPQQLPHADAVGRLAQRRLLDRRRLTALPADRSFARTPHRRGRGARPAVDSQLRQGTHRSAPPDTGARHAGRMALRERHRATLPHGLRPRAGRAEIPRRPQPVEAECDGAFRLGRRRSRSGLRHGRRREIHLEKRVVHLEDETRLGGHPENNRIKPDNERFRQAERRAERSSDYAEARKRRMKFNLFVKPSTEPNFVRVMPRRENDR